MSYPYRVVSDYPSEAFPMNPGETAGFIDASGNGRHANNYGTMRTEPPLVVGGGNSYTVTDQAGFSFSTKVWTDTYQDFSLEAWFRPLAAGSIQILGHNRAGDGLIFDGEAISFITRHSNGVRSEARWPVPSFVEAYHLVGVHTGTKNQLYVNGEIRAEEELSDEQMESFAASSQVLYVGQALSGAPSAVVDSIATYRYSLSQQQIRDHFSWGRELPTMQDIVSHNDGGLFAFTDEEADIFYSKTFSGSDWNEGQFSTCVIQDNLFPNYDDEGVSLESEWQWGLPLSAVEDFIAYTKIQWEGEGNFTVHSSLDRQTWNECISGRSIASMSRDFGLQGQTLFIRIIFLAGQQRGVNVSSLSIKMYRSSVISGIQTPRVATLHNLIDLAERSYQPIQYHDDFGLELRSGWAVIEPDLHTEPKDVRTVGLWFKPSEPVSSRGYLIDSRIDDQNSANLSIVNGVLEYSFATVYVNGVVYTGTPMVENQWTHVVMVFNAPSNAPLTVGSHYETSQRFRGAIGSVALYERALNQADSQALYSAYLGLPGLTVLDSSIATIAEATAFEGKAARAYSHDWSITGAG